MLGDRDLCFLDSWEPRRSRGRSGLLPLGCQCLRARSRLLGGEHSRSQGLDPDHLCFRLLLPRVSWEELPELHERDRDPRQPRPREPLSLLLSPSLAFFRLARSWPLEWSLEDLRLLALSRCLLEWSSPAGGDMDCEVLSPERELERVLLCSLAAARFLLSVFPPRELDVECKQGEDCSSTMRCVAGGGVPGSAMVTQVTVRSSEPKKVLQGSWSLSSQGSGGDGLCTKTAGPWPIMAPPGSVSETPSVGLLPRSLSMLEGGARESSGSIPKPVSTV